MNKVNKVKTKTMVEASTLTALFVIISFIAIGTGLGNLVYIDFIVPIIITLIYFRCGKKYTILSSIVSIIIIILFIGDMATGVFISQSMIFGLICGTFVVREENILDDLFYSSIFCCVIIIIIDINFSGILGYSLLKESQIYVSNITFLSDKLKNTMYYVLIISFPIGIMMTTYVISLFLGKKLNLLSSITNKKFLIIKNFKRYGSMVCCSKKSINIGGIYLFLIHIFYVKIDINQYTYINIVLNSIKYLIIYFLLQDSYKYMSKLIFLISKSKGVLLIMKSIIIYMLIKYFFNTTLIIIGITSIIDNFINLRKKQSLYLTKILV